MKFVLNSRQRRCCPTSRASMAMHLEVQEVSADLRVCDVSVRCLVSNASSEPQTPSQNLHTVQMQYISVGSR